MSVALITGATRGIGKAIAIKLSKEGYDIAINYRKENEELNELKKKLNKTMLNVSLFKVMFQFLRILKDL